MTKPTRSHGDDIVSNMRIKTLMPAPLLKNRLMASLAMASTILFAHPAWAQQTVTINSQPIRVTVADSATNSFVLTNFVNIASGSNQVDLSVSGLPAGASGSFDVTAFTNSGGANLTLNTTNIAPGENTFSIDATGGATNTLLLILQSGRMWNNVTNNWSASASWVGGVVPGAANDVLFTDLGAQAAATVTNSIVDVNTEIASLRFSQTNNTTRFHTVQINPGQTLSVTGPKGFTMLRDDSNSGNQMDVNFTGIGGRLMVSNSSANFSVTIPNQVGHRLNLTNLGTLVIDVNRVGLGDYRLVPNYGNLIQNGYGGNATFLIPRRFIPIVSLARTNIIRAIYADPNNYTNAGIRDYSFTLGNNDIGTTADSLLDLGITNAFFVDSICFVQSSAQSDPAAGGIRFNPVFNALNPSAYFRGTNGGRLSVFVLGDAAGIGVSGTGTKAIVNFSAGTIDALVDRLYLGRDRTNSSDNASAEATLTMGNGVLNANTAILGYQDNGNNLNVGGNNPAGPARGTMTVNSNGVFTINTVLELGHTTADLGNQRLADTGFGRLFINNNGVVRANSITVGGVTKATVANAGQNTISIANSGNLIVTNSVGAADARLGTLTMANSARLSLVSVSASSTNVHVQSLLAGSGIVQILSVPGAGTYPLISYGSAVAGLSLVLPSGFFGYLVDNAANKTIDAVISTIPPKTVIWRGSPDGNWDTTTTNWIDSVTLTPTNFSNGDAARFDDTATGTTTVTVVGTVFPAGGTTITNSGLNYTFNGGTIAGTATTVKDGAGSLTINATHSPALVVSNGTFTVSATGVLNGGVTLRSAGLASNAGTINGPLSLLAGTFVNQSGAVVSTAPGTITTATGTTITNLGTFNVVGQWSIAVGATLVHLGQINHATAGNNRLTVNGTLIGTGTITDSDSGTEPPATLVDGRLVIASGGTFSPGTSIGVFNLLARLDINSGSTTIIEVDLNNPATNDVIAADRWSTIQGNILMTNIGVPPFAVGQSFKLLNNNNGPAFPNNPDNANQGPRMLPPVPGIGMQWNTNEFRTNGIVSIIAAPATPPALTNVLVGGTNLTLSWAASHLGYQVQIQTNSLTVGLSTNWVALAGSELTNRVNIPIDPANPVVFIRLSNQ